MFEFHGNILNVSDPESEGYRVFRLQTRTGPELDLLLPPIVAVTDGVPAPGDEVGVYAHSISGSERVWRWSNIALVAHHVWRPRQARIAAAG